ncbi:hypothetical protein ACLOJK_002133 [Asimina triloba]
MKNKTTADLILTYGDSEPVYYYSENLEELAKGQIRLCTRTVSLIKLIDLSSNDLFGEIPESLTNLSGLHFLNLSGNHPSENIPGSIGKMVMLESLDLSRNELSGMIPPLHFLSRLNLSYNNLTGTISFGNRLQALTGPSIYLGNAGLCGPPLSDCDGNRADDSVEENDLSMLWFYVGIAV